MTSVTPELEALKVSLLNLSTLKRSTGEVFGFVPSSATIDAAIAEVISKLKTDQRELSFICGHCRAPIDGSITKCWACGSVIEDEVSDEQMATEEIKRRAADLKINPNLEVAELLVRIEAAEQRKREKRNTVDLVNVESRRLNEIVTEAMPDGWSKVRRQQYTAYKDHTKSQRFCIFDRGLLIHFRVEDGLFSGHDEVEFLDEAERKRRHFGNANYLYHGDLAKEAEDLCRIVFGYYGGKE